MRKKYLLLIFILISFYLTKTPAQTKPELIIRSNLGIGVDYNTLEYDNANDYGEMPYSPGGGIGLEVGFGQTIKPHIDIYGTFGYQQNLALQYYKSNSGTDKTSFTFNRKTLLLGANYNFRLFNIPNLGLIVGGGGSYNIPGKMVITELNKKYGDVKFKPGIGFVLETGASFELNTWIIYATIRYRNIHFKLKRYDENSESKSLYTMNYLKFKDYIQEIDASGVDLSLALRRKSYNR